jgi:hypothetical protein
MKKTAADQEAASGPAETDVKHDDDIHDLGQTVDADSKSKSIPIMGTMRQHGD